MSSFDNEPPKSHATPLRGVLLAVAAVAVGVIFGHFVWSAANSALHLNTASNRFGSLVRPSHAPGSSGGSPVSPRAGSGESSGPSSEEGEEGVEGAGGGNVSSSVTNKVDPGLVDINSELGLQGSAAAGTGMVVTSNGEVITNNHVITGATKITATDAGNGKTYVAHVVGYDYGHDIAVLQLEGASDLTTVSFGDSSSLKTGQSIATIGNAGGAGGTPTATGGQVSGLDESITANDDLDGTQEKLTGLIQIAGDVQPGDSGGPLVNGSGEVLGMDTAASSSYQLESSSGESSSSDEGFAIPSDEVQSVANQILEGHTSETVHIGATGMLGVMVESQGGEGAVIESVVSGSAAAQAGLAEGDVITSFDGTAIGSSTELSHAILRDHPGSSVKITWTTPEEQQRSATVTLTEGPPE
ncbi:MAG TPA: trypsin-like peptidase domain-containing protein [Solirubrobacteraceae bacterium]|nr:trypsin-like peptidase domain-containing protein [Solirubrobacteraceae bacterium]